MVCVANYFVALDGVVLGFCQLHIGHKLILVMGRIVMHVLVGSEVDDRPIRVKIEVIGEGDFGILVVQSIVVHIPILQIADHVKSAFID